MRTSFNVSSLVGVGAVEIRGAVVSDRAVERVVSALGEAADAREFGDKLLKLKKEMEKRAKELMMVAGHEVAGCKGKVAKARKTLEKRGKGKNLIDLLTLMPAQNERKWFKDNTEVVAAAIRGWVKSLGGRKAWAKELLGERGYAMAEEYLKDEAKRRHGKLPLFLEDLPVREQEDGMPGWWQTKFETGEFDYAPWKARTPYVQGELTAVERRGVNPKDDHIEFGYSSVPGFEPENDQPKAYTLPWARDEQGEIIMAGKYKCLDVTFSPFAEPGEGKLVQKILANGKIRQNHWWMLKKAFDAYKLALKRASMDIQTGALGNKRIIWMTFTTDERGQDGKFKKFCLYGPLVWSDQRDDLIEARNKRGLAWRQEQEFVANVRMQLLDWEEAFALFGQDDLMIREQILLAVFNLRQKVQLRGMFWLLKEFQGWKKHWDCVLIQNELGHWEWVQKSKVGGGGEERLW